MDRLSELLAERDWLMLDGATGTNLFAMGLEAGEAPELWNVSAPEKIRALHRGFIEAGSDLVLTNSFGGTRYRLKLHQLEGRVTEINQRAAEIARRIADKSGREIVVAGSMGPTGELFQPLGALTEEDGIAAFREQALALKAGGARMGCLQAQLNIYNSDASWFTRQFTVEYTALFDCILPTLERLQLPVPLGGTSNHFPRAVLDAVGGWDPYNVTEDADLGARLARSGYVCRVLDSTTHEEAPCRLLMWLKQRTRWLKGYVQTWLVHMRSPRKLLRELGPWGFASFQIMVGGTVLSALVHPWFYVLLAADAGRGVFAAQPDSLLGLPFWTMAWINLGCGYLAALGVGLLAVHRRGYRFLLRQVPLMPFYWLLVSVAA